MFSLTGLVLGAQVSLRCSICILGVSLGPLSGSAAGACSEVTELSRLAASTRDQAVASVARCCRLKTSTSSSSAGGRGTGYSQSFPSTDPQPQAVRTKGGVKS